MAVAISETAAPVLPNLQPLWHPNAPARLALMCPTDDPFRGWHHWQKHLRARKKPLPPPFLKGKRPGLLWGWPAEWQRENLLHAVKSRDALAEVVSDDDGIAAPDLVLSLEMVGLAYALPELAKDLSAERWWRLVEQLYDIATQAAQHGAGWPSDPRDVLRQQLLAGELPHVLGYLFPEVRGLRSLKDQARVALSEAIVEVTDGQGLPHAHLLPILAPLFACWTRVRWMGSQMARGPWSKEAELQYQWLLRQAIRLANSDGTFLFDDASTGGASGTQDSAQGWINPLFEMALDMVGDSGDLAAAEAALPRGAIPTAAKVDGKDLPAPSLNSDWSGIAVLADGWSPSGVRLAINYADEPLAIDLSVGGKRLLAGRWSTETTCDGKPVQSVGQWQMLCWEKSGRYNFLELGIKLSEELRLERQILFGCKDRSLYLADIVISSDGTPRHLQHSVSLPLGADVRWQPEASTRDGVMTFGKQRAAVFPLALSEWRNDPRGGSLVEKEQRLVLSQTLNGRAICCPLFFDLDRKRSKNERTWRQLTVGESMEIVPRDLAVGYRAQSGGDQWLFYRSLGPVGNRTFLGQNIAGEFSAGRFYESGKYKEWIEIETV